MTFGNLTFVIYIAPSEARPVFKERVIKMLVERSEFKGKPMLVIKNDENDKFPLSFGITKAKKILNCIEDIKKFVEDNEKAA